MVEEVKEEKMVEQEAKEVPEAPAKTYEEHVLRELDAVKEHADILEDTIAALQDIFFVRFDQQKGEMSVEIKAGALDPKNKDLTSKNIGLLVGLFGDRAEIDEIQEKSEEPEAKPEPKKPIPEDKVL